MVLVADVNAPLSDVSACSAVKAVVAACTQLLDGAEAKAYWGLALNYKPLQALVDVLVAEETINGERLSEARTLSPVLLTIVYPSIEPQTSYKMGCKWKLAVPSRSWKALACGTFRRRTSRASAGTSPASSSSPTVPRCGHEPAPQGSSRSLVQD